ncbi:LysM peptidoglycan-binding domain-containing protein [Aestuariibius sp. HNIBRBA575]|uniref:LysM peptidoglycan-binding domain-containing protein n=1 Tax=Aestuariibius sp. HNIBRBA575 TaxID=3233343 RepID=UPI0034A4B044
MAHNVIWQYLAGGVLAGGAVVATVAFIGAPDPSGPAPEDQAAGEPAQMPVETDSGSNTETAVIAATVQENAAPPVAQEEPETSPPEPTPVAPEIVAPQFTTIRIEPDGNSIIAGSATPDQDVAILVARQEIARISADANGQFVALFDISPSDQPRGMQLLTDPDGAAVLSAEIYLIEPFGVTPPPIEPQTEATDQNSEQVAAATITDDADEPEVSNATEEPEIITEMADDVAADVTEPDGDIATITEPETPVIADQQLAAIVPNADPPEPAQPAVSPDLDQSEDQQVAEPTTETEIVQNVPPETEVDTAPDPVTEPDAPAILAADADGVRVVQPSGASPDVMSNVALDTITYDPSGDVSLAGRAQSEGFVQVYLDNTPITTSRINQDGRWRTDLPQVDTGVYTLRVDEIAIDGTVVSRIETPFKREEAETVAEVMAQDVQNEDFQVAVRTVQPGNTLWAIARDQYGDGVMYVHVFEANRDLIRDADLIYPGQIFRLPEMDDK